MAKNLKAAYLDPVNPASFGGVGRLRKESAKQGNKISLKQAKNFLAGQDAFTFHKQKRRKFERNKFIIRDIDDLWQADLADMTTLARHNNGNKYILVVIDSLTKYVWIRVTKKKDSETILQAIQSILITAKPRKPRNYLVDKGGEFKNKKLLDFMKQEYINFYTTQNPDTKAAIAERVIRTLKGRIFRYLTSKNTFRYIDVVDDIVQSYNNTQHRTINMAPSEVTEADVPGIKHRMYPFKTNMKIAFKFNIGDQVRLAAERTVFDKGYKAGWTEEIFTISKLVPRDPPVYKVKDALNEEIEGTFYNEEPQKIHKDDSAYKIEKIIDKRKRGKRTEYLIKWLGYPTSMSSWEPETNISII